MIKKASSIIVENRFLAIAVVLSIILHIVFLSNWLYKAGHPQAVSSAFTVTISKLNANKKIAANPKLDLKPSNNKAIESTLEEKAKSQLTEKLSSKQSVVKPSNSEPINTEKKSVPTLEIPSPPDSNDSQDVVHVPSEALSQASPRMPSIRQTPDSYQYVESEFETVQINDPTNADLSRNNADVLATSKVIFIKQAEKNAYQLTSTIHKNHSAETTQISSVGEITAFGLRPSHYAHINNADGGINAKYADFFWADGLAEEYDDKNKVSKKLTAGAQDELSYLYQFMYNPPTLQENIYPSPNSQHGNPNELQQNANTYTYIGEEILQTNFGELKTIHILKKDDLIENTELWLAVEYNYLPVKIRKKDENGLITEQIVTKISLKPPQNDSNLE